MKMRRILRITIYILVFLLLVACSKPLTNLYSVESIVDGDTIKVHYDGSIESVRLIGIDTPEIHFESKPIGEFGEQAKELTKYLIEQSNYKVKLEFDEEKRDRYERLLAYVYTKDGTFINEYLLLQGLARPLLYDTTPKYNSKFKEDYKKAFENRRGIFSKYENTLVLKPDESNYSYYVSKYLGKIIWLEFMVKKFYEDDHYRTYCLEGNYAKVAIRMNEYEAYYKEFKDWFSKNGLTGFYSLEGKTIRVYGELWENEGKPYILFRAPFEIKIVQ